MNKIKLNDEVIVIAGKDKGSTGTVTKITTDKVVVEGLLFFFMITFVSHYFSPVLK